MATKTSKTTKTKPDPIARMRKIFSLKNVKARYEKIGHRPVRNYYDVNGASCLLGSFEHAVSGMDMDHGEQERYEYVNGKTAIPTKLLHAMEAGWEGWVRGRRSSRTPIGWFAEDMVVKTLPLPRKGSDTRKAYDHGQRLAKAIGPDESAF